jgi:hypothetical protein
MGRPNRTEQHTSGRTSRIRPGPDAVFRRVGEDGFLVSLTTNRMFQLNETSARFWELVSSGSDRAEAERTMLEEFDVAEQELQTNVQKMLVQLKAEGLIVADDGD